MFLRKNPRTNAAPAEPAREKILEIEAATQGALTFKEPIHILISGSFEGSLETAGTLTVGAQSRVRARLQGSRVIVLGEMVGDVSASESLKIAAGGRLIGEVRTPELIVEPGAVLQGEVIMIGSKASSEPDPASAVPPEAWDVDRIAAYLSVERSLIFEWADSGRLPGVKDSNGWHFDKRKVDEWVTSGRIG